MADFKVGVVFTAAPGRQENLKRSIEFLIRGDMLPDVIVVVLDGFTMEPEELPPTTIPIAVASIPKHEPGMEQPRNVGVRLLKQLHPEITHAWFLDSDIVVEPHVLSAYRQAAALMGMGTILIGPYEWLPGGVFEPHPEIKNDYRWAMFEERGLPFGPWVAELGVALGCFGGNLVWPIEDFIRVGGFHPQLHHGRCEDGELGLRAASAKVPMALISEARGYHVAHPVNVELAVERNARDVPLLNSWHPWVEQQGLVVTHEDGARFEFVCACGEQINTLLMWAHMEQHSQLGKIEREVGPAPEPEPELILPDGL